MDAIPSFWRGQVDVLKDKPWCGQGEVTDSHEPEVRAGIHSQAIGPGTAHLSRADLASSRERLGGSSVSAKDYLHQLQ